MPFSSIFNIATNCSERRCRVNKKNIKVIYKPDGGFLNKALEKKLFPTGSYKICDCITICKNDNIAIIEILCGTLTFGEYKEKCEQLENCCKVIADCGLKNKVKKIILLYKNREPNSKNSQFRKKLLNPKICSIPLFLSTDATYDLEC